MYINICKIESSNVYLTKYTYDIEIMEMEIINYFNKTID